MSLAAHATAVLTLLYAEPRLVVYPAQDNGPRVAPNGASGSYVTVHFATQRPKNGRLTMRSTRMQVRIYVHCTGATDDAARRVADLVAGVLLDTRPVVAGRVVYPIDHETGQPPRPDESTGRLASTLTEIYMLRSEAGR